jgi:hypothetical protein
MTMKLLIILELLCLKVKRKGAIDFIALLDKDT